MLGGRHPRRRRGSQPGWEKRFDEGFQGWAAEPLGTDSHPEHFQAVNRMLALIGHKKCEQHLLIFFREFVHDSYRLDLSLSVSCTKEMHTLRKLSVWYKLPISNTVYPKTKDAFPVTCVAWRFVGSNLPAPVSLPSPAFLTLRAQPKPPCYAGYFSKNTSLSSQQEFTLTATKTSHEKWIHIFWVSIVITPTRLLCQMQANSSGAELLWTISKLIKKKKLLSLIVYVLHKLAL